MQTSVGRKALSGLLAVNLVAAPLVAGAQAPAPVAAPLAAPAAPAAAPAAPAQRAAAVPAVNQGRNTSSNPFRNVPVSGVAKNGQRFSGELDIARFQQVGDTIVAIGTLTGKLGTQRVNSEPVAWPVDLAKSGRPGTTTGMWRGGKADTRQAVYQPGTGQGLAVVPTQAAGCDILNLVLGPLDLNLLGLQVDLNQLVLNIVAVPGAGLLGDLLCAIVNLLNPLGQLFAILEALNNLLNLFNGLFP